MSLFSQLGPGDMVVFYRNGRSTHPGNRVVGRVTLYNARTKTWTVSTATGVGIVSEDNLITFNRAKGRDDFKDGKRVLPCTS